MDAGPLSPAGMSLAVYRDGCLIQVAVTDLQATHYARSLPRQASPSPCRGKADEWG